MIFFPTMPKKMWPITALNYCKIVRLFLFLIIILLPIQVILTFSESHMVLRIFMDVSWDGNIIMSVWLLFLLLPHWFHLNLLICFLFLPVCFSETIERHHQQETSFVNIWNNSDHFTTVGFLDRINSPGPLDCGHLTYFKGIHEPRCVLRLFCLHRLALHQHTSTGSGQKGDFYRLKIACQTSEFMSLWFYTLCVFFRTVVRLNKRVTILKTQKQMRGIWTEENPLFKKTPA